MLNDISRYSFPVARQIISTSSQRA